MKRNKWLLLLIVFMLLVSSACAKDEKNIILTTTQTTTEALTSRKSDNQTRAEPYSTVEIPVRNSDPYAELVKARYERLSKAVEAEEILAENYYAFYDIDGNGIDELFFNIHYFRWGYDEFSKDEPEEISIPDELYTVQNGKVVDAVESIRGLWDYFGESMGGRDILSNGVIRCYGGSPEHISYAYCQYEDGELTFLKALKDFADTGRWLVTYEGDQSTRTPITEEEFNRLRAEIEGDAQVVEIDWKPLESYGRE